MTIHTFNFQWKPEVTDAQKETVAGSIRALQGKIPGLLAIYVGTNFSPRSKGYNFGGTMHFADRLMLEAYNTHPVHQALLPSILPLVESVIEVDFEA